MDRDSIQGNPPYVTFTGLQASSHAIGSNFTFEFVSFFMNTEVRITSPPFKILPAADSLQISLWGPAPELQDPGPWMLRQQLLPITVSVMGGQGADRRVADSLIAEDRFFLVARLFNKVTSNDITASSLRGQLRQQVLGGAAVFPGLSMVGIAGSGFALSFFLDGTAKVCAPGSLLVLCEEQSRNRGSSGGLGGYYVEMQSQPLTVLPDRLSFSYVLPQPSPPVFGRVGDVLSPVQVAFYDAVTGAQYLIQASEGLTVEAFLYNGAGTDITGSCLSGTRVRTVDGGYAVFDDLAVQKTAGLAFTLALVPAGAWRNACLNRGVGTRSCATTGKCCAASPAFAVQPYALSLSPPSVISGVEGVALVPGPAGLQVSLVDSSGQPLPFLDPSAGYQVL